MQVYEDPDPETGHVYYVDVSDVINSRLLLHSAEVQDSGGKMKISPLFSAEAIWATPGDGIRDRSEDFFHFLLLAVLARDDYSNTTHGMLEYCVAKKSDTRTELHQIIIRREEHHDGMWQMANTAEQSTRETPGLTGAPRAPPPPDRHRTDDVEQTLS